MHLSFMCHVLHQIFDTHLHLVHNEKYEEGEKKLLSFSAQLESMFIEAHLINLKTF